jgi:ketosteroid isomerase-like protein
VVSNSDQNVELAKRAVDAWNGGDLNLWMECFDEDIVWIPLPNVPDLKPTHGREAMLELIQQWLEPWDRYDVETLELADHGDTVIWTARHLAFQKRSGMALDQSMSAVFVFREGRIAEFQIFPNKEEALEAARLRD